MAMERQQFHLCMCSILLIQPDMLFAFIIFGIFVFTCYILSKFHSPQPSFSIKYSQRKKTHTHYSCVNCIKLFSVFMIYIADKCLQRKIIENVIIRFCWILCSQTKHTKRTNSVVPVEKSLRLPYQKYLVIFSNNFIPFVFQAQTIHI